MILHDCESLTCEIYFLLLLQLSIRLHVAVSVRECTIDYLIERTCIYISVFCYVFMMLNVMCLLSCQLV